MYSPISRLKIAFILLILAESLLRIGYQERGLRGLQPPFQISKLKESNKTKQKIDDNPIEREEERKNCMFV